MTLSCQSPPGQSSYYSWSKESNGTLGDEDRVIPDTRSCQLMVTSAKMADRGQYRCEQQDSQGTLIHACNVSLIVHGQFLHFHNELPTLRYVFDRFFKL